MPNKLQTYSALAGRVLLATIFVVAGLSKLAKPAGSTRAIESKGLPAVRFFLAMTILFEAGAGMLVMGGLKTRVGALALALYLVPVTLIFHNFWSYKGEQRDMQMQHFLKNVSIIGGLLLVAGLGPGSSRRRRWLRL